MNVWTRHSTSAGHGLTVRSFCRSVLVVRRLSVPEVGTANNEDFKRLNVLTHLLLVLGAERRDEIIL